MRKRLQVTKQTKKKLKLEHSHLLADWFKPELVAFVTVARATARMCDAFFFMQSLPHVLGAQNHKQHRQALVGRINASAVSAQQQWQHMIGSVGSTFKTLPPAVRWKCMVAKQGGLAIMTGNTQTQWGAMPCIACSLDFLQDELAAKVPKVLRESSLHACVRVREAERQEAVTQVAGSHKHCTFVPPDAFKTCKPDIGGSNGG